MEAFLKPWGPSACGSGDPTIADAILDRLVHNAHRINLKGESLRKPAAKRQKLDAEPVK